MSLPHALAFNIETTQAVTTPSGTAESSPIVDHPKELEKNVERIWALAEIARCESGDRHYDSSGEVIRGKVNPQDIGRYQINLRYHQKTAEAMGLDLFNEKDNEAYAEYLYSKQGAQPWSASNNCHHLLG